MAQMPDQHIVLEGKIYVTDIFPCERSSNEEVFGRISYTIGRFDSKKTRVAQTPSLSISRRRRMRKGGS